MVERAELPDWVEREERALVEAHRSVRLLGAVTAENATEERERLVRAAEAGQPALPRWTYARVDHAAVRRALDAVSERLARETGALAGVYAARARELALEAGMVEAAGTPEIAGLADERFGSIDPASAKEASRLAGEWITEPGAAAPFASVSSDARDPGSLVSRLRAAVARIGLPFEVVVHPALSSLAAVGERQIYVAEGRRLSRADVDRTVIHEIEGHARPRARAAAARAGIFLVGTARGVCDQEGLALVLEERHAFLGAQRRRELAARHLAVEAMREGGTFVEVVRVITAWGFAARDAVMMAERAFRGSTGAAPGIGRERVYIEAYVRVKTQIEERPDDEGVLAAGQVAVGAIEVLRGLCS